MTEQNILSETRAFELIEDPRYGLGEAWCAPAVARALSCSAPFEDARSLCNAIRVFMSARATPDKIDRFLKLWTSLNALRNHIAARFEAAQEAYLHLEPGKLPRRYRIQMMDYLSLGVLAVLVDPAHPLPCFGALRSRAILDARGALGDLAEDFLRECKQNPRGAFAQLIEEPHTGGNGSSTATQELFALVEGFESSPLVFVMLIAAYEMRNGLLHGTIPLPLLPDERREELRAMDLCSLVLDAFLDQVLPQAVKQLDTGDGRLAPFPEPYRKTIADYLDHRFDGQGIFGILRKYGIIW